MYSMMVFFYAQSFANNLRASGPLSSFLRREEKERRPGNEVDMLIMTFKVNNDVSEDSPIGLSPPIELLRVLLLCKQVYIEHIVPRNTERKTIRKHSTAKFETEH